MKTHEVRTKKAKWSDKTKQYDLWVQINDYGIGASPQEVERILKAYYQCVSVFPLSKADIK